MKILFIQAGGTIDKDYPKGQTNHGYNFEITDPSFNSILKRAKPDFEYKILSIIKKDSLDMDETDREKIYSSIISNNSEKIIITHGTDTIHLTAKKLADIKDKTIILTGSMLPEKFRDSDADFNIGMAVGAAQTLNNGVYIALYGKIVSWDKFSI